MLGKRVKQRYKIVVAELRWDDDYDHDDVSDAIDHYNHQANLNFKSGIYDVENVGTELFDPEELLTRQVKDKKPKGWLKDIDKDRWADEFKKVYGRDISHILTQHKIKLPVLIENILCDGYARTTLAYALGEKLPVALFEKIKDEDDV
jgi:hypothetical protein